MTIERVDLYKYFGLERKGKESGYITTYLNFHSPEFCGERKRPAMIVFPGGGYCMLSDREKEPVALAFAAKGFNAFTVEYSVAPERYPVQLTEAVMAVLFVRENADKFNLDKDKISAIGFSAGGHLLGTVCTAYKHKDVAAVLGKRCENAKLNAAVFSYPVVSSGVRTHAGSMQNLANGDAEILAKVSVENNITKDCPPAFIWTTADDACVPSENSLMLASAYKKAGVPFELHIFESGEHGSSLCIENTAYSGGPASFIDSHNAKWFDLAVEWLNRNGFKIML